MLFPPVELHWARWEDGQICTLVSEALQIDVPETHKTWVFNCKLPTPTPA